MFFARSLVTSCVALLFSTSLGQGHEFWIDVEDWQVDPGAEIVGDLVNGEFFAGPRQAYLPSQFRRFDIIMGDLVTPVPGRVGDRPALKVDTLGDGLASIVHVTNDKKVSYTEFEKFVSFVEHKAAPWVVEAHEERDLPKDRFGEAYSRYAKALVAVGQGAGSDAPQGLLTEIVALANPYTDDLSDGLPVQVLYQGEPKAAAHVEVFERPTEGDVRVFTVLADGDGVARIPVQSGHTYLLDSVVLREPAPELAEEMDVIWESLWAALTFRVPSS